jgi:hypothetical protein
MEYWGTGVLEYWNKFILYYLNDNDSKEWHAGEKLNQLQQCWTFPVELVSSCLSSSCVRESKE